MLTKVTTSSARPQQINSKSKKNITTVIHGKSKSYSHYHKDGTMWAKGKLTSGGIMDGYWEWFRKDGSKMLSSYFQNGKQADEWITYDKRGNVYKKTMMKAKGGKKI